MTDESALRSLLQKVASAPDSNPAPAPGTAIGRYELVRVLGSGGFGIVYEARDRELDRGVALKLLRADDDTRHSAWFAREAKAMARLGHPNIITMYDYGEHEGRPYLVLELLRGMTLADVLATGALPLPRALAIATGIARALDHAHRAGVIHLDLKPSNVFLGENEHVTVLDFGLARLAPTGNRATRTTESSATAAGTPAFMPPEQERGEADARSDVFAVGVLLYAMLTGELPFVLDASSVERVVRPPRDALGRRVPGSVIEILERCLATDPAARFANGGDLAAALRDATSTAPVTRVRWIFVGAASGLALALVLHLATRTTSARHAIGTWNVNVPARTTWRDSGVDVVRGQPIHVLAKGSTCTKPDEVAACSGPDGQSRVSPEWALPGLEGVESGRLAARIDDHPFALGSDRTVAAPASGRLWLGINDRDAGNNDGPGYDVTVILK